jgi:CheY-like chemotaxis protein
MRRILVIDDELHVRTALSLAMRAKGFEVVTAQNGLAGLRAFRASQFDLAIVDIFMPEMDGVKLIKALRERNPNFPVIAVSGMPLPETGRTALDLFPLTSALSEVVCLKKPFRPAELMEAIAKALAAGAVGCSTPAADEEGVRPP